MKGQNYGLRVRRWQHYVNNNTYNDSPYQFASKDEPDASRHPFLRVRYLGRRPVPIIATDKTQITVRTSKGQAPTNEVLLIRNIGESTLNFSASEDAPWLDLSGATTGTSTNENQQLLLAFDTTSLTPGAYQATITITDTNASNSPFVVPVLLTVLGPAISVSTTGIAATAAEGANPTATTLEIWNSGYGTLDFSILKSAAWLVATPASGTSTGEVRQIAVQFASAGLNAGNYQDTLTVTNTTGEAPSVSIPVTLTVLGVVATPTFNPFGNTAYPTNVSVSIYCTTPGATVRYTLDGSSPTESSPQYTGTPILVTTTTVLRAKAWKDGMLPSSEQISTYTILALPPTLGFSRQGSSLIFNWPTAAAGFALEYATNLPTTNWRPALPAPSVVGELNIVTNTMTGGTRFYRLKKP